MEKNWGDTPSATLMNLNINWRVKILMSSYVLLVINSCTRYIVNTNEVLVHLT